MTLHDELQRIADRAPVADVPAETWARARGARKRDVALTVAGVAAVLALLAAAVAWVAGQLEAPIADTGSVGVPDHLYAVPLQMSDRNNVEGEEDSWKRDEVTDDPTVVRIGAAAWLTDQGLPVVVDAIAGGYHLLNLPDFIGNVWRFTAGLEDPAIALSPDGRELAYSYAVFGPDSETEPIPSGIRVVDLATGRLREIPVVGEEGTAISHIEWSPDGSWLAFAGMQQSYWTRDSMGTSQFLDSAGPVLGRVPPGTDRAEVKKVDNDEVPLSVDDRGTVQWQNGKTQVWGPGPTDPRALESLGRLPDGRWLMRTGTASNDVLSVKDADTGRRNIVIDLYGIDGSVSIATDLMPPDRLTVERPEPDWPATTEHRAAVIGLVAAGALLTLWLVRRYLVAR
jgi:hypothetical protein